MALFHNAVFDSGGNPEAICMLLNTLCDQPIEDSESEAGKLLPTILIVSTLLINCTQLSVTGIQNAGNQEG